MGYCCPFENSLHKQLYLLLLLQQQTLLIEVYLILISATTDMSRWQSWQSDPGMRETGLQEQ